MEVNSESAVPFRYPSFLFGFLPVILSLGSPLDMGARQWSACFGMLTGLLGEYLTSLLLTSSRPSSP